MEWVGSVGDLMIAEGAFVVRLNSGCFESAALSHLSRFLQRPPDRWLRANVHVQGRPSGSSSLHTHSLQSEGILSPDLDVMFGRWRRLEPTTVSASYVTARDVQHHKAAEAGHSGNQ